MYTQALKIIKISALATALSLGISFAYAWTEPTQGPTGGNTAAPLNTSTANQIKTGGILSVFDLWVDSALVVLGGASFGGKVGIGTTEPKQKLDVAGSISMGGGTETASNYILGGTAVTNSPFLQLFGSNYSDSTRRGEFTAVSYGAGDIRFYNQPSANIWNERMKITSAGAVTIPGTLGVTGATTLSGGVNFPGSGIWNSSGNVGIGTTEPTFKFEVYGDGARSKFTNTNTANMSNVMNLQNNSTRGFSSIDFFNSSGSQVGFIGYGNASATKYADKMYIGSVNKNIIINPGTANVGIGTTEPGEKLEINGNLKFTTANPYISASSFFVAPGGAYFNSGTVYTTAAIQARGGIANDLGDLNLADNVSVSGNLTVSGISSGALYAMWTVSNGYFTISSYYTNSTCTTAVTSGVVGSISEKYDPRNLVQNNGNAYWVNPIMGCVDSGYDRYSVCGTGYTTIDASSGFQACVGS